MKSQGMKLATAVTPPLRAQLFSPEGAFQVYKVHEPRSSTGTTRSLPFITGRSFSSDLGSGRVPFDCVGVIKKADCVFLITIKQDHHNEKSLKFT